MRYLSRHELGMSERIVMEKWLESLKAICKKGTNSAKISAGGKKKHFIIELKRVERFLKNYPR